MTTRTLNPLPFQDLEPHRFEDLVRNLVYNFRPWKQLEATGRSGSDEGIDIRGIEGVAREEDAAGDSDEVGLKDVDDRLWVFQCKRERSIGPAKLVDYVADSLDGNTDTHGFVIAAACDFSKKARDAFRDEMVKRGVEEFHLWGKADLEDMLFQPQNDHLLFAYFGLSLQPRRRSRRTALRSLIATKKLVHSLFKEAYDGGTDAVCLLRDSADTQYPVSSGDGKGWLLVQVRGEDRPDGLLVTWKEHPAWISRDFKNWDAIESVDLAKSYTHSMMNSKKRNPDGDNVDSRQTSGHKFWLEYVPEEQQAKLSLIRIVPWARILAIDPHGDDEYPVPHIWVEFDGPAGPFTDVSLASIQRWGDGGFYAPVPRLTPETHKAFFPDPLPKEIFPPPPDMVRATSEQPPSLPLKVSEELEAVLAPKTAKSESLPDTPTKTLNTGEERNARFRSWTSEVAVPTFSSFIEKLRSAGHEAWILPKSDVENAGTMYVELQVRMVTTPLNRPVYYRSGHVRYEMKHWGDCEVAIWPREEGSRDATLTPPKTTLDMLTVECVQSDVLKMLNKLTSQGY